MTMQCKRFSFFASRYRSISVLVISSLVLFFWIPGGAIQAAVSSGTSPELQKLSIPFVENQGQTNPLVSHYAQTMAGTLFVTKSGDLVLALPQGDTSETRYLTERFQGATIGKPVGVDPSPTRVSYFLGNNPQGWQSNLPVFTAVRLDALYPGITGKLRSYAGSVEKLFEVAAGADPNLIQIEIDGADRLAIGPDGELTAQVGDSSLRYTAPVAFQQIGDRRVDVDVAYYLDGNRYGFKLGQYDDRFPLVIDPLLQATYLGGSGSEEAWDVAVHPSNNYIYVTGKTSSADFPGPVPAGDPDLSTFSGATDVFVARLDTSLTNPALRSVAYIGGTGNETGRGITVTPAGDVFVTGYTTSVGGFPGTWRGRDLPYPLSSDDPNYPFCSQGDVCYDPDIEYILFAKDAFLIRLSEDLTALTNAISFGDFRVIQSDSVPSPTWCDEEGEDLAWDETSKSLYVVGTTNSAYFPEADGDSFQGTSPSNDNGFVSRFVDNVGFGLVRSTFLGAGGNDSISGVAVGYVGAELRVYVTGYTGYSGSINQNFFPNVSGGTQSVFGGQEDAFVAYFNNFLTEMPQASYIGGDWIDHGHDIAVTPNWIYVTGYTNTEATTQLIDVLLGDPAVGQSGAYDTLAGAHDAFVARLIPDLVPSANTRVSYYGGSVHDRPYGVAVNNVTNDVYIMGTTRSFNLPGTDGGAQSTLPYSYSLFLSRFSDDLGTLRQATYLGGNGFNETYGGLAIGYPAGGPELFVTGYTDALVFPQTSGGIQDSLSGARDAFVARYDQTLAASSEGVINVIPGALDFGNIVLATQSPPQYITIENLGAGALNIDVSIASPSDFAVATYVPAGDQPTPACPTLNTQLLGAERCSVEVSFSPSSGGAQTDVLSIVNDSSATPTVEVALAGTSEPDIEVLPATITFPGTLLNTQAAAAFSVYNRGGDTLNVTAPIAVTGDDVFSVTFGGAEGGCVSATPTLAAGESCRIDVVFQPTAVIAYTASVVINSNDPDELVTNVNLSGSGVPIPDPAITANDLDFGDVVVGQSSQLVVIVRNEGAELVVLLGYTLSDPVNFSVDPAYDFSFGCGGDIFGGQLQPGTSCGIGVTFGPTVAASFDETLTIHTNAAIDITVILVGRSGIDSDGDGVLDIEEAGDANNDGIADAIQANVASLHSYDDADFVAIESSAGTTLSDVRAEPLPIGTSDDYDFPFGFFGFTVTLAAPGDSVDVIFHVPPGAIFPVPEPTYVKFGPTWHNLTPHYYDLNSLVAADIVTYDAVAETLTITLRDGTLEDPSIIGGDGGIGDHDGALDAKIVDPGAPAMIVDVTKPVITLLGSSPVNIDLGTSYTDAGATATDDIDGDITSSIVIVNPVNVNVAGTYIVTYNVSDTEGNAATEVTRTVNVTAVVAASGGGGSSGLMLNPLYLLFMVIYIAFFSTYLRKNNDR